MKDWIFAFFWASVISISLILCSGCRKSDTDPHIADAKRLCRQHCPKDKTFSFRVEFRPIFPNSHWACYCYPQFGAPVIKRFSREIVDAESKRKNFVPMKMKGEQGD